MEEYQLQIGMNSIIAAQLWALPKRLQSPPNGDFKKRFLKRCCISVIIRHGSVVAVIYLSHGYSTVGPWSYSKTNEITV